MKSELLISLNSFSGGTHCSNLITKLKKTPENDTKFEVLKQVAEKYIHYRESLVILLDKE